MAAVMAVSCTESNKYVINGTIANNDGKTVYLNYQIGDSTVKDSAVIADGKFMFEGTLDRPYRGGALIIGDMNDMQSRPGLSVGLGALHDYGRRYGRHTERGCHQGR